MKTVQILIVSPVLLPLMYIIFTQAEKVQQLSLSEQNHKVHMHSLNPMRNSALQWLPHKDSADSKPVFDFSADRLCDLEYPVSLQVLKMEGMDANYTLRCIGAERYSCLSAEHKP